jgi:hypothetical protein
MKLFKVLLPLGLLLLCHLALGQELAPIPTPKMSMSFNPKEDQNTNWQAAHQAASPAFFLMELTPNGTDPKNWNELVTSTVTFNVELDKYMDAWVGQLQGAGAQLTGAQRLPDGSILIAYTSPSENGIWRYIQGPDATYGLSYQTRPSTEDAQKKAIWEKILRSASLVPNPLVAR